MRQEIVIGREKMAKWKVTPDRGVMKASEIPYGSLCASRDGFVYVRLRVNTDSESPVLLSLENKSILFVNKDMTLRCPLEIGDAYQEARND